MASIAKIGDKWRAQIRRKGHPSITQTFHRQAHAKAWAARIEVGIRAGVFNDERRPANSSTIDLIDKFELEMGKKKAFGRSKSGAIDMLKRGLTASSAK